MMSGMDEGDGIDDVETPDAESTGRQRGEKEGRTDQDGGLSGSSDPWVGNGVRNIPPTEVVELQHAEDGKQKAEKPEKGAGVFEAEIELEERRQQEHREDKRGKVIAVGHGNLRAPWPPFGMAGTGTRFQGLYRLSH